MPFRTSSRAVVDPPSVSSSLSDGVITGAFTYCDLSVAIVLSPYTNRKSVVFSYFIPFSWSLYTQGHERVSSALLWYVMPHFLHVFLSSPVSGGSGWGVDFSSMLDWYRFPPGSLKEARSGGPLGFSLLRMVGCV